MIKDALKNRILAEVFPRLAAIKKELDDMQTKGTIIKIPVQIEGVVDTLAYDNVAKKFVYLDVKVFTDDTETDTRIERIEL